MRREQFQATLQTFLSNPGPYRHLYVWHGQADDLNPLLPPGRFQALDVFALAAQLDQHPFAQDEASELLRDALRARLRDWRVSKADAHPILVVRGCKLLARYSVPLQPFYEALTHRSMVILTCSAQDAAYASASPLPRYVRCEPGATLAYLSRLAPDGHVVQAH